MSVPPSVTERARSQLAQLVADTIIAHTPHTAEIGSATTVKHVNTWLDGLEEHTAGLLGPFLQQLLEHPDMPDALRPLLAEGVTPTAAFSATIGQIFAFAVASSVISTATAPFLIGLQNNLYGDAVGGRANETGTNSVGQEIAYQVPDGNDVARPVDPATIATAVGRGLNLGDVPTVSVPDWAYQEAANQGIDAHNLNLMASIVGLPPALQQLFEMQRRGIITETQVKQGLREGDFRDDWIDFAVQLAHAYLTPLDFVNAAVREQMPYTDARGWAATTGLEVTTPLDGFTPPAGASNDMFGLAFAIAGRPPGPQELADMTHRNIIPQAGSGADALTFQQGIAESDVKTKWTDALFALSQYLPTVEATATLLEKGGYTPDQAAKVWAQRGVSTTDVAALSYVATQEHHTQERLLVKGDILKGYYDGIFSNQQATEWLGLLGYSGDVAAEMLELQDFRRQIRAIDMVVRKVGTLYETFKISATDALATMADLGVPANQATALLGTWDELRIRPVRVPTPTEIGRAVKAATITEAEGLQELADLGYQPRDAAIVLSSESGAAVTPLPPAGTTTTG